jgi:hypothetical protein
MSKKTSFFIVLNNWIFNYKIDMTMDSMNLN